MATDFKITVIAHVFNESALIKHWLIHHKRLFDRGVIIDYNSTDDTVSIIKSICPEWKIIKPTEQFGECVNQIHDIEKHCRGWKMTLNITEFLFIDDLRQYIINFEKNNPNMDGIRTRGCIIVDTDKKCLNREEPLIIQYTNGYFEEELTQYKDMNDLSQYCSTESEHITKTATWIEMGIDGRSRFLHKRNTGMYLQGRHSTLHENVYPRNTKSCPESDLILLYFGYAPYDICTTRHANGCTDRTRHLNIDKIFLEHSKISYNLMKDDNFKNMLNCIKFKYTYPPPPPPPVPKPKSAVPVPVPKLKSAVPKPKSAVPVPKSAVPVPKSAVQTSGVPLPLRTIVNKTKINQINTNNIIKLLYK